MSVVPDTTGELPGGSASGIILLHKTIKKVGKDIEDFKFNTAISALMILLNELEKSTVLVHDDIKKMLKILHPFAPHMAQELWSQMAIAGESAQSAPYLDFEPWPQYDPALVKDEKIKLVLQVNSRGKDSVEVDAEITEAAAKEVALANEKVKSAMAGGTPKKIIYVPGKLVNVVI
jgi:leucyl-tRNA synthetase